MSRELKFRAYDKVNSKMLDGVIPVKIQNDQPYMIWGNGMNYLGTYGEQYTMETFIQLGQFEIMQFTGLKDKNGKEIYEGDVIESKASTGQPIRHEIIFDSSIAQFAARYGPPGNQSTMSQKWINEFQKEVVGNVYETPDLLKP